MPNQFIDSLSASLEETMEELGFQNYQRYAANQREKLTLFFSQGRAITAQFALNRAESLEARAKGNDDKARDVALLAENLKASIAKTLETQNQARESVSKMADATQVAAESMALLASEAAGVLAICEATLKGADIAGRAQEIDGKVKVATLNAEMASLSALDSTTSLSESVIPAMVGATETIQSHTRSISQKTFKLFTQAKNDYMKMKEAKDKAMESVSAAFDAFKTGERYLRNADRSLKEIRKISNFGLEVEIDCGQFVTASCGKLQSPFEKKYSSDMKAKPAFIEGCEYRLAIVSSKDVFSVTKEELLKLPSSSYNKRTTEGEDAVYWEISVEGDRCQKMVDINGNRLEYGTNYRAIVCVLLPDSYDLNVFSEDCVSLPSRRFRPRKYLVKANAPELDFSNSLIRFSVHNQKRFKGIVDRMEFRAMLIPRRKGPVKRDETVDQARKLLDQEEAAIREISRSVEKTDTKFLNTILSGLEGDLAGSARKIVVKIENCVVERMKQIEDFDAFTVMLKDAFLESDIDEINQTLAKIKSGAEENEKRYEELKRDLQAVFSKAREHVEKAQIDEEEFVFDHKIAEKISPSNYIAVEASVERDVYEVKIDPLCTDVCGNLLQDNTYYQAVILSALKKTAALDEPGQYRLTLSEYSSREHFTEDE